MPCFFFFNDTATTEIYTLSLHDALPIYEQQVGEPVQVDDDDLGELDVARECHDAALGPSADGARDVQRRRDRKSTRLNSSHANISYAVFCLKKKNKQLQHTGELTLIPHI